MGIRFFLTLLLIASNSLANELKLNLYANDLAFLIPIDVNTPLNLSLDSKSVIFLNPNNFKKIISTAKKRKNIYR